MNSTNIIHIKKRVKIFTNLVYIFGFISFFIAFFFPWYKSREDAIRTSKKITDSRPRRVSDALYSTTVEVLSKVDLYSKFQARVSVDPVLYDCNVSMFKDFILLSTTINSYFQPNVFRSFVYKQSEAFCMIEWNRSLPTPVAIPYYAIKHKNGSLILKKFDMSTDFDNFDPQNHGITIGKLDIFEEFIQDHQPEVDGAIWTDRLQLIYDNEITMTSISYQSQPYMIGSGVSISADALHKEVDPMITQKDASYVLVNKEGRIVIESFSSKIKNIEYIGESTFWKPFLDYLHLDPLHPVKDAVTFELNLSTSLWLFSIEPIKFSEFGYVLYLAICTSKAYESVLHEQVLAVVLGLASFLLVFFLCRLSIIKSDTRFKKNDDIIKELNNPTNHNQTITNSVYYTCIGKLRAIELAFADDVLLNKAIDATVANIAEEKDQIFCPKLNAPCEFCEALVKKPRKPFEGSSKPIYGTWLKTLPADLHDYRLTGSFSLQDHQKAPNKELIRLILSIVFKERLLMPGVDPDKVFRFIILIVTEYTNDQVYSAFRLFWVYSLFHKHFEGWLPTIEDRFAIILSSLFKYVMLSKSEKVPRVASPRLEQEEMIINHAFNEQSPAVMAFIDRAIEMMRTELGDSSPSMQYVIDTVTDILLWTHDSNTFELIGTFAVRIESPDFSVFNSHSDRLLFMKALISFSEFACYMVPERLMVWACEANAKHFLTEEERADESFVAEYHKEVATKVARPWLPLLGNFTALPKQEENLKASEEFWESKIHS